jgi:hypothetical protein
MTGAHIMEEEIVLEEVFVDGEPEFEPQPSQPPPEDELSRPLLGHQHPQ